MSTPVFTRDLKLGDSGFDVMFLKLLLRACGCNEKIDLTTNDFDYETAVGVACLHCRLEFPEEEPFSGSRWSRVFTAETRERMKEYPIGVPAGALLLDLFVQPMKGPLEHIQSASPLRIIRAAHEGRFEAT